MRRIFSAAIISGLLFSNSGSLALPPIRSNRLTEPMLEKPNPRIDFKLTVDKQKFAWTFSRVSPDPYILYNHGEEKNYVCGYVSKDKTWGVIALKNGGATAYSFHNGTTEYGFKPFFYSLTKCSISENVPDKPNSSQRVLFFTDYI
ncbi:MAG: hypothetical protein AABX38_04520 [Candidatus Micrarchaeota archaeon]